MNHYQKFDEIMPFVFKRYLLNVKDYFFSQLSIKVFAILKNVTREKAY